MKKYRKKPIVIEAFQVTASIFDPNYPTPENIIGLKFDSKFRIIRIETLEGEMIARIGDWIIKGIQGEYYPCKPDIFNATYEEVNAQDSD